MLNLKRIISGQNKKILEKMNKETDKNEPNCKSRGEVGICPIEGGCKVAEIIYEVEVPGLHSHNI